ncbi:uncharacterized protein PAC_16747 [Phialocephala subalpina]|uniref:Uncharacterized protein n=1 Tax=Phialocephala subalpina TaxID=576137 RepID=A0A1L7XPJ0_9HELO|nr:uncharacterized protein PAC_16747 [Phialocephala subalpina]
MVETFWKEEHVQQLPEEEEALVEKIHDGLLEPAILATKPPAADSRFRAAMGSEKSQIEKNTYDFMKQALDSAMEQLEEGRMGTVGARAVHLLFQSMAQRGVEDELVEEFVEPLLEWIWDRVVVCRGEAEKSIWRSDILGTMQSIYADHTMSLHGSSRA